MVEICFTHRKGQKALPFRARAAQHKTKKKSRTGKDLQVAGTSKQEIWTKWGSGQLIAFDQDDETIALVGTSEECMLDD